MNDRYDFIPYENKLSFNENEMLERSRQFVEEISKRRTIRHFSDKAVPIEIIENAVKSAATAPSGANQQPWHFVIVSSQEVKTKIQEAAEEEEREFYNNRAPEEWLDALAPLGTNESKPFLSIAPYLIVIFEERYGVNENAKNTKHYYTKESVGIACGMLITALHMSGLATLTHTPSPMNFLNSILERPSNEKPYLILVTGYPADDCKIPKISKKKFDNISSKK
jgi:iodotyrosine deiodinase